MTSDEIRQQAKQNGGVALPQVTRVLVRRGGLVLGVVLPVAALLIPLLGGAGLIGGCGPPAGRAGKKEPSTNWPSPIDHQQLGSPLSTIGAEDPELVRRGGLVLGGFVLAVGGETVTTDEVVLPLIEFFRPAAQGSNFEQFARCARPQIEQVIQTKVLNILLYKQARKEAGEGVDEVLEKLAEAEVKKFVRNRFEGDYARAQQALKQMGMNQQSFKELQKRMILNQSYIASKVDATCGRANRAVTFSELLDSYNEMKDEFFVKPAVIKFWLIDIKPDAGYSMLDTLSRIENRESRIELANELMVQIRTINPSPVTRDSSDERRATEDELQKLVAELPGVSFVRISSPVQPKSLAEPYDILASVAEKMEPGQVAGPIETETGEHIFIMKLVEKRPQSFEPFEKVQRQVEEKILEDRRKRAVAELRAKLAQQAALAERGEFIDFCLERIHRICNE